MEQLLQVLMNNGVGVFFGYLFYSMANGAIKENTKAINELTEFLRKK